MKRQTKRIKRIAKKKKRNHLFRTSHLKTPRPERGREVGHVQEVVTEKRAASECYWVGVSKF